MTSACSCSCTYAVLSSARPRATPDPGLLAAVLASEGERALAERRYEDAAKAYEKLRELSPGTAEVHAGLGLIYFQQRRFAEAVPALRQALKLKPALPGADILLAMSLSELGQFKEALPGLRKGFRQTSDVPLRRSTRPAAAAGLHRPGAGRTRRSRWPSS